MRYVVLDTNCLIQVLPTKSLYHKIWTNFLEGKYRLCVSNEILSEYEEILSIHTSPQVAHTEGENRELQSRLLHIDKDDDKFVDCAITANADYIVTEDNHFNHLKKIPFPQLNVVTLDEFNDSL